MHKHAFQYVIVQEEHLVGHRCKCGKTAMTARPKPKEFTMKIEMTTDDACFSGEESYPNCANCGALIEPGGTMGIWMCDGEDNMFAVCAECADQY